MLQTAALRIPRRSTRQAVFPEKVSISYCDSLGKMSTQGYNIHEEQIMMPLPEQGAQAAAVRVPVASQASPIRYPFFLSVSHHCDSYSRL